MSVEKLSRQHPSSFAFVLSLLPREGDPTICTLSAGVAPLTCQHRAGICRHYSSDTSILRLEHRAGT